jgi:hypothetical protein
MKSYLAKKVGRRRRKKISKSSSQAGHPFQVAVMKLEVMLLELNMQACTG